MLSASYAQQNLCKTRHSEVPQRFCNYMRTRAAQAWRGLPQTRRPLIAYASHPSNFSNASQAVQAAVAQLRADPVLSKILDKPSVQAAIRTVQRDPTALREYVNDADIMKVLTRLLDCAVPEAQLAAYADLGTSPSKMAASIYSNTELSRLLNEPSVVKALAAAGEGDFATLETLARNDCTVARALELLEGSLDDTSRC